MLHLNVSNTTGMSKLKNWNIEVRFILEINVGAIALSKKNGSY
jgi:hypothetical protein